METGEPMVSEADLQIAIKAYKDGSVGEQIMIEVVRKLAELVRVTDRFKMLPEVTSFEAAEMCLEKLSKYSPEKCKAFHFLTSIIACYFIQMRSLQKKMFL